MTTQNLPAATPPKQQLGLPQPVATPIELISYHKQLTQLIQESLTEGIDYGTIPGTGDKPVLLKPGAERLCMAFGAHPEYSLIESDIEHDKLVKWTKRGRNGTYSGESYGLYRYVYECQVVRSDGRVLGQGQGVCSTMESKYVERPRDVENTVAKMAQKRAFVAAVLNAFALSNRFTQDVEETVDVSATAASKSYVGSTEQQRRMADILRAESVPEDLWPVINEKMMGKPATPSSLKDVTKEVLAQVGTI